MNIRKRKKQIKNKLIAGKNASQDEMKFCLKHDIRIERYLNLFQAVEFAVLKLQKTFADFGTVVININLAFYKNKCYEDSPK